MNGLEQYAIIFVWETMLLPSQQPRVQSLTRRCPTNSTQLLVVIKNPLTWDTTIL